MEQDLNQIAKLNIKKTIKKIIIAHLICLAFFGLGVLITKSLNAIQLYKFNLGEFIIVFSIFASFVSSCIFFFNSMKNEIQGFSIKFRGFFGISLSLMFVLFSIITYPVIVGTIPENFLRIAPIFITMVIVFMLMYLIKKFMPNNNPPTEYSIISKLSNIATFTMFISLIIWATLFYNSGILK